MINNIQNPYSDYIIKQWVDECTGKFINPITVTDAVITKHGKTLTEILDLIFGNLKQNKTDITNLREEFDAIKLQIQNGVFATKEDLDCLRTQLNTLLESIKTQLQNNTNLFTQLLSLLTSGQPIDGIGDLAGYVKTIELLDSIRNLNKFAEKVKSEMTNETYNADNSTVTLPPTVGGMLYVGDTKYSNSRFYFTLNGDVDGDGYVTSNDVAVLYDWLLLNDESNLVNPDVNEDGVITSADVSQVYDILLNGRPAIVHDKVTNKNYTLPEGTTFINNDYIYYVESDGYTKIIGTINSNYNEHWEYGIPSPHILNDLGNLQPIDATFDEDEKARVTSNTTQPISKNGLTVGAINPYILATVYKNNNETTQQAINNIKSQLANGTFNEYSYRGYKSDFDSIYWRGVPQRDPQGLISMVKNNVQFVEPLGTYADFKNMLIKQTKYQILKTIEIVDFNAQSSENRVRFFRVITKDSLSLTSNQSSILGNEVILAEDGSDVFCWKPIVDMQHIKPVIVPKADFPQYIVDHYDTIYHDVH